MSNPSKGKARVRGNHLVGLFVGAAVAGALLHCHGPDASPPRERVAQTTSAFAGAATYSQVDVGDGHACAIRATDKRVDCWGANDYGESLAPLDQFTWVSAEYERTCGVRVDGSLACWGHGIQRNMPTATGFTYVGVGSYHACALAADGTPSCWFADVAGIVDRGETTPPAGKKFSAISAGAQHTCGLVTDGTIACWGSNTAQQTAAPTGTFKAVFAGAAFSCAQRQNDSLTCWGDTGSGQGSPPSSPSFSSVSFGGRSGCGISSTGSLVCWGDSSNGLTNVPPAAYSQVSLGNDLACAIKTDGTLACWGRGRSGQAVAPTRKTVTAIRPSLRHGCALESDGTPFCWGTPSEATFYYAAVEAFIQGNSPFYGYDHSIDRAQVPLGKTFADIVTGLEHSCGLGFDGVATCWGSNTYGQLNVPAAAQFTQIASRGHHTCGLTSGGKIRCWGLNVAPFPPQPVPYTFPSDRQCYPDLGICPQNAGSCSATLCVSIGTASQGSETWDVYQLQSATVPAPGGYESGQSVVPTALTNTTFSAVTTGLYNTCGRKSDGTWACWGDGDPSVRFCDSSGQNCTGRGGVCDAKGKLGNCSWNDESAVPPSAGPLTSVSTRQAFSAGLKPDGTPVFWGSNLQAQFDAPLGVKFTDITVGAAHGCGLQSNHAVSCWGNNGQNATFVPPGVSFAQVRAGENNTCGLTTGGEASCWGANAAQQSAVPTGYVTSLVARMSSSVRELCEVKKNGWVYCQFGSAPITAPARAKAFGYGEGHLCVLGIDGTLACGGSLPMPALPANDVLTNGGSVQGTITDLRVGARHTCILVASKTATHTGDGSDAYCWGDVANGRPFLHPTDKKFTSIAASGAAQFCGVGDDGTIGCYGPANLGGALPPYGTFKLVRGGYNNFCAIASDDSVRCWGDDSARVTVTPPGAFKDVAVGHAHACGLKTDGTVVCWGNPSESPAGTFRSITAGKGFTCGDRTDGMLACWGSVIAGTRDGLSITQTSATVTACQKSVLNLSATSGTPPLTYSIVSDAGQFPPGLTGLTLLADGTLSGIPVGKAAKYSMSLAVTDVFGYRGISPFDLTVTTGAATTITPVMGATPQTASAGAAFANPLAVVVNDCASNALPGLAVTYLAGSNGGATAFLSAQTAQTNALGVASVTGTSSSVAGSYAVTAHVAGGAGLSADFQLANVKDAKTQCQRGDECRSGFCSDGACCDTACTGTCESCDGRFNTKGTGTCSPVQAGIDPRSQCGNTTCAQDSVVRSACDGNSACQPTSETCAPYTCDTKAKACKAKCQADGDCATGGTCDQARGLCIGGVVTGTCNDATSLTTAGGQNVSCAPYLCAHGGCRSECVTTNDCAPGQQCAGKKCEPASTDDAGAAQNVTINAKRGCSVGASSSSSFEGWAGVSLALVVLRRRARRNRAKDTNAS